MRTTKALITVLLLSLACAKDPHPTTEPCGLGSDTKLKPAKRGPKGQPILSWCDYYGCSPCPEGGCPEPQQASIIHCCNPVTGVCVEVQLMTLCDPDDWIVICNWGQSNVDGSVTCYE